jgi:hypothetical protein
MWYKSATIIYVLACHVHDMFGLVDLEVNGIDREASWSDVNICYKLTLWFVFPIACPKYQFIFWMCELQYANARAWHMAIQPHSSMAVSIPCLCCWGFVLNYKSWTDNNLRFMRTVNILLSKLYAPVGVVIKLQTGKLGLKSRQRQEIFIFPTTSRPALEPKLLYVIRYRCFNPG